ncbi:MAG: DegT/DnrJ/EryC1/StrS family aminotransferase [Treponemataceae bacterium]|nr:DegT/DnrJ/EryC1/StrS family aminotransferase [Treponemataceae bacterium]
MSIQTYSSTIRRKEMDAVLTCMVDEKTGPGELNLRLVQQVKDYFKVAGAVALRSPALALKYALAALGIEKNRAVMVSALAPDWQYSAVVDAGYKAIVLDVDEETLLVTEDLIRDGIKKGGEVLLFHETSGFLPDFSAILGIGIPVIEDISQSAGSTENGQKAGTFGVFSILGLEQNDILTAGGGAVLMAPQQREWAVLKNISEGLPSTDRLPDINAALGFIQLKELDRNELIRKEIREVYCRSLMQGRYHTVSERFDQAVAAVYSFPVVLDGDIKDVMEYALRKDIETAGTFWDSIVYRRRKNEEIDLSSCIKAMSLSLRCLNFPLYPRLGNAQSVKIAKVLSTLP